MEIIFSTMTVVLAALIMISLWGVVGVVLLGLAGVPLNSNQWSAIMLWPAALCILLYIAVNRWIERL